MPIPNPPKPISQLLMVWTPDVVRAKIVSTLVSMGIRADLWPTGGVASSIITDMATIVSSQSQAAVDAISAGWLQTAQAGWLDWVAFFFYGQTRTPASFASGNLKLTNTGGAIFPPGGGTYAVGEVTAQNSKTKETYRNAAPFSLGAGPATSVTVAFECVDEGSIGNSGVGDIDTLVTSMLGVTVTNLAPILGVDAQSDDSLRDACWSSLGARSVRGPRTAYEYAISQAVNSITGSPVNINRSRVSSSSHTGQVSVIVASPSGAADPNDVTGVATSIEAIARPECVTVTTTSAVAVSYSASLTVYLPPQPGLTTAQVVAGVLASLAAFFESYPIGGRTADTFAGLHATGVQGAAMAGWPGIYAVDGATDLPMAPSEVVIPAITPSLITVSFQSQ